MCVGDQSTLGIAFSAASRTLWSVRHPRVFREIGVVSGHIKVAVPAQVEEDGLGLAGGLTLEGLFDDGVDRVRTFRRGDDTFRLGKQDARLEDRILFIRNGAHDAFL